MSATPKTEPSNTPNQISMRLVLLKGWLRAVCAPAVSGSCVELKLKLSVAILKILVGHWPAAFGMNDVRHDPTSF